MTFINFFKIVNRSSTSLSVLRLLSVAETKSCFLLLASHFSLLTFLLFFIYSCDNITDNISNTSSGIVSPRNNAKLNYTQVMFEYPEIKNAIIYKIQIAENITADDFEKSIIIEQNDSTIATLINGLLFGKQYIWRYMAFNTKGKNIFTSKVYKFEILNSKLIDKNRFRYNIITKKTNKGLIFLDTKVAINRYGEPIWFLPLQKERIADIKMTKSGSLTFISNCHVNNSEVNTGLEITINGDVIWETPYNSIVSGDSTEYFHHQFNKLDNGNYMILGKRLVKPKIKIDADKICFGTIIEYNSKGEIVWSWNSETHIDDSDLIYPYPKIPYYNINDIRVYDFMHSNGFIVDEQYDNVYISCQIPSRIIKIDKRTGNVIDNFGDKYYYGEMKNANNIFKYQHSPILLSNGNIAVFSNNNLGDKDTNNFPSSVIVFTQPDKNINSKIVWEFECNFDTLYASNSYGRGNINYLENTNFLVDMGLPVSRFFEVTQDKKIVWDCYAEKLSFKENKWTPNDSYRISYTNSLYPVYFTLNNSFNTDTINYKNNLVLTFDINNEGSNSDKYIVKYYANNKEIDTIYTGEILPYKKKIIFINLKNLKVNQQEITVMVSSSANPQFKRELKYFIN